MKLNQTLSERIITNWVRQFGEEFPDTDVDQLLGQVLDDYNHEDFDSPSDFMENIVKDRYPDLHGWWRRKEQKKYQLEAEIEHYEDVEKQERVRGLNNLIDGKDDEEGNLTDVVVDLCQKNQDYVAFLEQIIKIESEIAEKGGFWTESDSISAKPLGWQLKDVQDMTGGHIAQLQARGIIRYNYKSNQYSYFVLTELDAVKEGLEKFKELERQREADAKMWKGTGFLRDHVFDYTEEDVERFEKILEDNDALEYWYDAIAPKIVGLTLQKKAILIGMASLWDEYGDKNRTCVLLYGEPETAKSQLARTIVQYGGGWVAGSRGSKCGLTADCSGGEITYGALPRNHKGALGIDELDKFTYDDQAGLLESLESGIIPIAVGKFQTTLNAEVIAVATANELKRIKPELVSRFDFRIKCDVPMIPEAQRMMKEVIEYWGRPKGKEALELGKYLRWVRDFTPEFPQSVREKAKDLIKEYIMYSRETRPRALERLIRISLAIARLNHRDVRLKDFKTGIELITEIGQFNRIGEDER